MAKTALPYSSLVASNSQPALLLEPSPHFHQFPRQQVLYKETEKQLVIQASFNLHE